MHHKDLAVLALVYIQLDPVRAGFHGASEGGHGVFGEVARSAAVRGHFHGLDVFDVKIQFAFMGLIHVERTDADADQQDRGFDPEQKPPVVLPPGLLPRRHDAMAVDVHFFQGRKRFGSFFFVMIEKDADRHGG